MTPRACRLDTTHRSIVNALERAGYRCQSLAAVGRGCPDLIVSKGGSLWMIECKSPGGKLNDAQMRWHMEWPTKVYVASTPEEALEAVKR